jgi:N-acetylglucosaminyldiphosphoundecaprenol N-acetyl-beta-D-mannosaminyltransferase
LKKILKSADAVFADGVCLMKLAKLNGTILPERMPGPTFILKACEYGVTRNWSHFFFGGLPGVADELAKRLIALYPGLRVCGTFSPPFRPMTSSETADVKQRIEIANTDLLWVAMGSPKQEFWVAKMLGKIDVPVMLPVGAAFDFHTGIRPWAPALIRKSGMEWLYRMLTGGRATLLRNIRCVSRVAASLGLAYIRSFSGIRRDLIMGKKHRKKLF